MDDAVLGSSATGNSGQSVNRDHWSGSSAGSPRRPKRGVLSPREVIYALVAVLLVAGLCPFAPGMPEASAAGKVIEELPQDFTPIQINNNGDVLGSRWGGGVSGLYIYKDGELTKLAGGFASSALDFTDDGRVLVSNNGVLEIRSTTDVVVLPQPERDGKVKQVWSGDGPDKNGRVFTSIGYDVDTDTSAVLYQGASPPTLITQLATVFAMNHEGQMFGQLAGSEAKYAILSDGSLTAATGIGGEWISPMQWTSKGYLLYVSPEGRFLWHKGQSTPIPFDFPAKRVNNSGVLLGDQTIGQTTQTSLRMKSGQVQTLESMLGAPTGWTSMRSSLDINDKCEVIGSGTSPEGKVRFYVAHPPNCETIDFGGSFFRADLQPPSIKKGEEADVRLSIRNTSGEAMTNVKLVSVTAEPTDFGGEVTVEQTGEGPPTALAAEGPGSQAYVDFKVNAVKGGKVMLTAKLSATKASGAAEGTIESLFVIKEDDLVINLSLDPPEYEVPEDGEFVPTDITAKVSFTNATDEDMTNLRLEDLDVQRVFSGQELYVTYKSGIRPDPLDPEVIVPLLKAGATSPEFTAVFTATDDGEVEFHASAMAKLGENKEAKAVKDVRWKAKVKKFVEIKTTVANPPDDDMLNAGSPIIINGTIENLTNNYEITLGPLWPTLEGNTGTMSLAYDGEAPNPRSPQPVDPLVLKQGEKRTFQVKITTNYSDPRTEGAAPTGGTRAYVRFEPWGEAVEMQDPNETEPPDRVQVLTYDEAKPGTGSAAGEEPDAQVKATPEDLFKRVSIDDSIELPSRPVAAVAAGIMAGAVEGMGNAAIAAIYAIPDLVKMPYTVLVAAYDYQAKVWESFTEEEKDQFLSETSFMVVSILLRNFEMGKRDTTELYNEVYKSAGDYLTKSQNEWHTGDFLKTTQDYSAFLSEQIGSVAGPVMLSKMAQSPKAVAALGKWQTALNAKMASTFQAAKNVKYVDNVLPILQSIENGAEPTLTAIAKLWGITPDEIAEYQRICKVIGCLATVRSRHVSSSEWIKKWGALLKPENLKIKTVSDLDVMLGYDVNDLGSLVFRKPEILKTLGAGASKDQIAAEAAKFATSKGFKAGTSEYQEAVQRLMDKVSEWNKYEKSYKQWDKRGWIDTSLNYVDNAIPEYRFGPDGEVIGHLTGGQQGNFRGFRLREKTPGSGDEEYIVEMLDGKTGKFRRITGDIDPVDFTYTDGSPLTPEDHARLISMLQNSPLSAQHGYTSTFLGFKDPKTGAVIVDPGPELVKKQFKPNEAALQIGPEGAPRATRIDVKNSRWENPYDYNIRWINGFVDAGTKRARGIPQSIDAKVDVIPLDAPAQIALPIRQKPAEPTVGRFIIKNGNKGETAAMLMGANGQLQTVLPDGSTKDSELHAEAFSEGVTRTVTVSPQSVLEGDPGVEPEKAGGGGANPNTPPKAIQLNSVTTAAGVRALRAARAATASLSAGSTTIRVSTSEGLAAGVTGFEPGQEIAIGTGAENVELHKIASVIDGLITLTEPLERTHQPGEVVTMVVSAAGVPIDPNKGLDPIETPTTPPTTTPGTGTTPPGTGATPGTGTAPGTQVGGTNTGPGTQVKAATDNRGGALAFTGYNAALVLLIGLALVAIGMATANLSSLGRTSRLGRRDQR